MCTVVLRWEPGAPLRALALRDEPGRWWPEHPGVVGGRDRLAGGSWCVTDVPTGVTALVLNRPERRVAAEGAPSRGVLPLLAAEHRAAWPDHLDGLDGMASFTLLVASSDALTCWTWDGTRLAREDLAPGTRMVTSGGAEDGKAERHLASFRASDDLETWRRLVEAQPPAPDPAALAVRLERDDQVYATVFGQLLEVVPGSLQLSSSREPWTPGSWRTSTWS